MAMCTKTLTLCLVLWFGLIDIGLADDKISGAVDQSAEWTLDPSELFHEADADVDHYVNATEASNYFNSKYKSAQVAGILQRCGGTPNKLLQTMDVDGDNKISIEEFLTHEEPHYHMQLGEDDFLNSDGDEDGTLSFEEFKNSNYGNTRNPNIDHEAGYEKQFKELDTNSDGKLQKKEFLSHAGVDRFSLVDTDKDGFLSLEEYLHHDDHYYHTDEDPMEDNEHLTQAFEDLDRDKDGKLSRSEDNMIYYSMDKEYDEFKKKKPILAHQDTSLGDHQKVDALGAGAL